MKYNFVVLPFFASCLLAGCGSGNDVQTTTLHTVMLTQPQSAGLAKEKSFSGIVKEAREINVAFKTAGQLSQVAVKEGDYVREGQLIASLDTKDYQLALNNAQIQYDQMSRQLERMKKLRDGKSISVNDYDKAASGFEQLGIQLQNEKNRIAYCKLYAPASGYVQKVNFEKSEMVDAGTPIITILDNGKMSVEVSVPAELYTQRANISSISCKTNLDGDKVIPMKIESIVPKADGNQLYNLKLAFSKTPDKQITAGMNVDVQIVMKNGVASESFSVPFHSIFKSGNDDCVWVLNADSTISKRVVKVESIDPNGDAKIGGQLNGSEQIVKAGVNLLVDGEKVKVVGQPSSTNVGGIK